MQHIRKLYHPSQLRFFQKRLSWRTV